MIQTIWYNCKYGIMNLIKWCPTIWKDRDWDHEYLYDIMLKKLEFMEDLHRNRAHYEGSELIADQMKKCCELIEALLDKEYNKDGFTKHDKKWGTSFLEKDGTNYYTFQRKNIITDENKKEEQDEFRLCIEKERELEQKDKEELFETMKDNIDKWWD